MNLKFDLSFWVLKPYKERLNYVIDGEAYMPVAYRFLFLAIIIVFKEDLIPYELNPKLKDILSGKK